MSLPVVRKILGSVALAQDSEDYAMVVSCVQKAEYVQDFVVILLVLETGSGFHAIGICYRSYYCLAAHRLF